MLKFRLRRPEFESRRNLAEFGLRSSVGNQRSSRAAHDMGTHKQHIFSLAERRFGWQNTCGLLGREGFARQGSFINEEIFGFHDEAIPRDDISCAQYNDISRYNLFDC